MITRSLVAAAITSSLGLGFSSIAPTASADAGSPLSQADIQRVVQQNGTALKRTCWGPDAGATPDVHVTVHFLIAPSGNVRSVSSSGNDTSVGACIESVVANWTFPSSNGPTNVDIPFHFVRQ
jgi:hypothetical protein